MNGGGRTTAFLWSSGVLRNLGTLGGWHSEGCDINDVGHVVGRARPLDNSLWHAFLHDGTSMRDLGTLPGGPDSVACGINNDDQIVGRSQSNAGERAFLWQNGVMTDLNTLLPADTGWFLVEARAINDAGQIAGWGRLRGEQRAFRLTPVPPDTTAPATSSSSSPAPNDAGWNTATVTVMLAATDETGGSGVKQITLSASGAQHIASTVATGASASVSITAEGVTTITYLAMDNAGNVETPKTLTVKLDKTAPALTFGSQTPAPNAAGWSNTDVSIPFDTADAISGVASTTPPASPLLLSSQGGDVKAIVTVTDRAGNSASFTTPGARIDKTKPTVTYAGNAGAYTVDQVVSISCTPADSLSGVASHTCQNISGPAYGFQLGSNAFSATATDTAGNIGSGSTNFAVKVTYASLSVLTRRFVKDASVADSLCAKLDKASAAAASGKPINKKSAIDSYVNQVTAQTGKALTAEQATILIGLARAL